MRRLPGEFNDEQHVVAPALGGLSAGDQEELLFEARDLDLSVGARAGADLR